MINRLKNDFTVVPSNILNNKEISLGAKGLYVFLSSKPELNPSHYKELSNVLSESISNIKEYIEELIAINAITEKGV